MKTILPHAVLLKIDDPDLQLYMQQYPYATGPDESRNRHCLEALRTAVRLRPAATPPPQPAEGAATLTAAERDRLDRLFVQLKIHPHRWPAFLNDYAWRVKPIAKDATRVLSIGCGDGSELVALRAVLPTACIDAIDWTQKISEESLRRLKIRLQVANFITLLSTEARQYDVIFTNHVLEHLYDPDIALKNMRQWLRPGGTLVSALPLDADPQRPYFRSMMQLLRSPTQIKLQDLDLVDAGHPWKTNLADLNATLLNAGFNDCRFLQRSRHVSRLMSGGPAHVRRMAMLGRLASAIVFGLPRRAISLWSEPPLGARKALYGFEKRLWVGRSRLKNLLVPEVLVIAKNVG